MNELDMMNEHDDEPIRGLPGKLPEGERILWQGAPDWQSFARRVFKDRWIASYFIVLIIWSVITAFYDGGGASSALLKSAILAAMGAVVIGFFTLFAWAIHKTTVYTITNRRIVVRRGVALALTINLPFKSISDAGLKTYPNGTGDIPLTITEEGRVSYFIMWPHARPWRLAKPEPMLRLIPDAKAVAETLADAFAEYQTQASREELAARVRTTQDSHQDDRDDETDHYASGTVIPAE